MKHVVDIWNKTNLPVVHVHLITVGNYEAPYMTVIFIQGHAY